MPNMLVINIAEYACMEFQNAPYTKRT